MEKKEIKIHFSAFADSIEEQCESQGFRLTKNKSEELQSYADSILNLYLSDILTEKEKENANKRVFSMIKKSVKPIKKEKNNV